MLKYSLYTTAALLCFATQGFARTPFQNDPLSAAQSVLTRSDNSDENFDAPVASEANATAAMPQSEMMVSESADDADSYPAPMIADQSVTADPAAAGQVAVTASEAYPVSRSYRSSRRSGGILSDLIELEKRKNAWIRRNIFGR